MSIRKFEVWVNPGLKAKQLFVFADSVDAAIAAVPGDVFSCVLHELGRIWTPLSLAEAEAIRKQWHEQERTNTENEQQWQSRKEKQRRLQALATEERKTERARLKAEREASQPKPVNWTAFDKYQRRYEMDVVPLPQPHDAFRLDFPKVRIVEPPDVNLPVPVTEMPKSESASHMLSEEVDNRARAMLQWAPWARRQRRSRRYEGYSR